MGPKVNALNNNLIKKDIKDERTLSGKRRIIGKDKKGNPIYEDIVEEIKEEGSKQILS